jgi:hypothetical protein
MFVSNFFIVAFTIICTFCAQSLYLRKAKIEENIEPIQTSHIAKCYYFLNINESQRIYLRGSEISLNYGENIEELNTLRPHIFSFIEQNLTNNIHVSINNKNYLISIEKNNLSALAYITNI